MLQDHVSHFYWWLIHLGIVFIGIFWFPGQIQDEWNHMLHFEPPMAYGIKLRMQLTAMMFLINIMAYYRVRFSSPGYALPDADPLEDEDEEDDVEAASMENDEPRSRGKSRKFCERCRVEQSLKVKHCRVCNRCIMGWDHHCLWVGTCIWINNHRFFFLYLGSQTICTILALDLLLVAKLDLGVRFSVWILLIFFLMLSLIIIGGLFCWHSVCAISGRNSRELMSFGGREEVQKVGTCTRCCLSLEGFIAGRPSRSLKRRSPPGSHKCLETCDLLCDNKYFSCF